jgi:hypothetical protein
MPDWEWPGLQTLTGDLHVVSYPSNSCSTPQGALGNVSHQKSGFRSAQGSRGHQRNGIVAVLDADGVAYKEAEAAAQRLVADLGHAKAVDAHIGIRVLKRRPHAGCAQPTNFLSPLIIFIIITRYSCQKRQGASCRHTSDDGQ